MNRICWIFVCTTLATSSANAAGIVDQVAEIQEKELRERCGDPPLMPAWYDRLFKTNQQKAAERYQQCLSRLSDERARASKHVLEDMERTVFNAHTACQGALKRISRAPGTLSFRSYRYDLLYGYNSAGVDITEGGYSVDKAGSDINGGFRVRCYMSKQFTVTHVR